MIRKRAIGHPRQGERRGTTEPIDALPEALHHVADKVRAQFRRT